MAVIIGAGTQVVGMAGVVSANWDLNPSIQRLWVLDSWSPYDTILQAQQNVTITVYADGGPGTIDLVPSTSCTDSTATFSVTIIPASCSAVISGPSGDFYLTSYSYSKGDTRGYGQQSFVGTQWQNDPVAGIEEPSLVLLGISEGQYNGDLSLAQMGVTANPPDASGYAGSVSAGFPGLGQADTTYHAIFNSVGIPGAIGKLDGYLGNASVTVPHQPLWLPV